jgi:hypothetical protein
MDRTITSLGNENQEFSSAIEEMNKENSDLSESDGAPPAPWLIYLAYFGVGLGILAAGTAIGYFICKGQFDRRDRMTTAASGSEIGLRGTVSKSSEMPLITEDPSAVEKDNPSESHVASDERLSIRE